MSLLCCTYHLSIVGVVSTGVVGSPSVEVGQSGHGALEVILLHPGEYLVHKATRDNDGVLELDGACPPVIKMIMTIRTLCSPYTVCQFEA